MKQKQNQKPPNQKQNFSITSSNPIFSAANENKNKIKIKIKKRYSKRAEGMVAKKPNCNGKITTQSTLNLGTKKIAAAEPTKAKAAAVVVVVDEAATSETGAINKVSDQNLFHLKVLLLTTIIINNLGIKTNQTREQEAPAAERGTKMITVVIENNQHYFEEKLCTY